ncbi:putative iron-dependent peroxidase [Rhodococcus sp. PvR044]|jgi:porphyrinogen peroxidase|uniref:Dyp-type peroxidase n=1 Tax=unclassified Rhodococcus (in: high G+C Gram-positive bacteria) TaxID=192944 RepID=UPI000BCB3CBB|nr:MULTISPECIES: Dyp-type peroxidase [unclassified Rhodococcus (in: high G+C Gram-positive bacteria)]MBP1160611.1 putative iron-dependent peroxidase [Rhodococcus sp. PvR099]PTR43079.1 putative iron-dependent peroxidase [Rhodococcus sp. OK611]SNX91414.1 putative iron-dependent peroxidase [Rhodococcus sp. OK270]
MTESPRPPRAPESQTVTSPLSPAAIFLVATVDAGGEALTRSLLADAAGLRRAVGLRVPGSGLELIVSIGSDAWDRLFAGPRPAQLHPFPALRGGKHQAPSTPGDLLFHIRAMSLDACFELAHQIAKRLAGAATVVDEVHGFQYFENRDLIGFVDGTENPSGRGAVAAVTVGDEDPAFAGGSYVHVQKYLHDMSTWEALPVPEQEKVIGRTKLEDIEMSADVKPANSHVALNAIKDEQGESLEILRANMPFGRVGDGEMGTYFIGYCRTPAITERMLANMFLGDPPGNYDRLLDFSVPVTGSAFFTPSADFFDALPGAPTD